jgi:hypothetical protein
MQLCQMAKDLINRRAVSKLLLIHTPKRKVKKVNSMSLVNENGGMVMPVGPMYGNGGNGLGWGGDGSFWIIILFLFAMFGNGWGGFGGGYGGYDFPWLLNGQNGINNNVNDGFRDAQLSSSVMGINNAVTSGFGDVQTALCGGFAGVNATVNNAQNLLAQQLYTNEIASLNRSYDAQTANTAGHSALQSSLQQCCCDNRLATSQTQNIVQTEGAATRLAIQNQTQQILDKLCAQEIETLRERNVSLQNQVNMLNLAASQTAQSAYLIDKLTPAATTTG